MPIISGLSGAQAVSGNGRYRAFASEEILALHTCTWRGGEFTTLGDEAAALFAPNLPSEYSVRQRRATWTGKAYEYRWKGSDLTLELRTTLPGPLFATSGRILRIRAAPGAEWRSFQDLQGKAPTLGCQDSAHGYRASLLLIEQRHMPIVIASSQKIIAIRIISHMYYEFEFARDDVRMLVVPILVRSDIPTTPALQSLWSELVCHPPLQVAESFTDAGDSLTITARFPGATKGPIPVFMALLGAHGGLLEPLRATTLLQSWCGPYQVADQNRYQATVNMGWSHVRLQATTPVEGPLSDIPEELAYAGDATWEPGTAMDQLLSLRTWAPLLGAMPVPLLQRIVPLVRLPSLTDWRNAVETITEPTSRLVWGRLRSMWAHNGDACYDIDWYNGLVLSGLARAVECGVTEIAEPARRLSAASRKERDALCRYFMVFHDWSLCTAWTDPRGWLWNADCLHNGLEGLLAESRLRASEGDARGCAHARYLAARHAIGLRASMELPAWTSELKSRAATPRAVGHRMDYMVNWSGTASAAAPTAQQMVGVQAFTSWREVTICTTMTRNPYVLAGLNAEWNALLRAHTSKKWRAALSEAYDQQPERYQDWVGFYLGDDWRERQRKGDQEARIQASVFYAVSPEIAFRRFVLGEDAPTIEARYATPLPLSEQLLLRAGFILAHAPSAKAVGKRRMEAT